MRLCIAAAIAVFALNPAPRAETNSHNADEKRAFLASIALLSPKIVCRYKYPTEARTNTVAGFAQQAGLSVPEMLKSFEHERQSHENDFAANPDKFCDKISSILLSSGRLDVWKNSAPTIFSMPPAKPVTKDQKERYLFFIASAGFYAVNDRCELGGNNEDLLSDIGALSDRLQYSHRFALQYFVYGANFYIKDHQANPKRRCKLAPLLLKMTRDQIGF